MRSVGIFGGSFDPVHFGHLALARRLIESASVEEVWLMVSPQNPLKADARLTDDAVRLTLARKAVIGERHIVVSDFEMTLPRPSYTWRTLQALRTAHPDIDFSLIVGADNWCLFDRWARHDEILARHKLLVYPRPGYSVDAASLPPGVVYVDAPPLPFSSTEVRRAAAEGKDVSRMVPATIVEDCIRLYKNRS